MKLNYTFLLGVTVGSLLSPVDCSYAQGNSGALLTTFTNPAPSNFNLFGGAVAAVGNDRVLISDRGDATAAFAAGLAFLFSIDGTLLTTFTNPTPADFDTFGWSVAALGSDRVIIGAIGDNTGAELAGAVYLFSTNGTLLTTITNPAPASEESFGNSVAAVGSDRVLVGAYEDNAGAQDSGSAYLFSANGTLLTTFTNPTPVTYAGFGWTVTGLGSNRVLIGARGVGKSYLFSTNGTLITTFTNPTPPSVNNFDSAMAALGSDRVLLASPGDGTGADTRAAYLFSTNGTLLITFTNPAPPTAGGYTVAVVGNDRVLIGTGEAAYLFSTNGALLTTFTPATGDYFGSSTAAVGSDRVIIGGNSGNVGAAFLYAIPYPPLSIARSAARVLLKWVTPETGLVLQQAVGLSFSTVWSNTSDSVSINGLTNVVQQTMVTTNRFFRLHRP